MKNIYVPIWSHPATKQQPCDLVKWSLTADVLLIVLLSLGFSPKYVFLCVFLAAYKCANDSPLLLTVAIENAAAVCVDPHGFFWEHRCHVIGSHHTLGTAMTFSYLTHSYLIPLLLNEPLDHPANLCSWSNSSRKQQKENKAPISPVRYF